MRQDTSPQPSVEQSRDRPSTRMVAGPTARRFHEGWEFERDLESQGHGRVWRLSGMAAAFSSVHPRWQRRVRRPRRPSRPAPLSLKPNQERLVALARQLLAGHPLLDATGVEVLLEADAVVLAGSVATTRELTLCDLLLAEVRQLVPVENRLTVLSRAGEG